MTKLVTFILILFGLLVLIGCEKTEPPAKIDKPVSYDHQGVKFQYPSNWKVTEDTQENNIRYLSIDSPAYAVSQIIILSRAEALKLKNFAKEFSSSINKEMPLGKTKHSVFSPIQRHIKKSVFHGIKEKLNINIAFISVPHTREYFRQDINNRVVFYVNQVADEDYQKTMGGFSLILDTFKITTSLNK